MKTNPSKLSKPLPSPEKLCESAIEPALRRVGALQGHTRLAKLSILGWFVKLAQMDLKAWSPAEVLTIQEEYAALQRHFSREAEPIIPRPSELERVKKYIAFHLSHLVDYTYTVLGPIKTYIIITVSPKVVGKTLPAGQSGICSSEARSGIHSNMVYEMALLLKEFAAFVVRCPRCKVMFVKPRSNAEYCSRSCQNSHYMQQSRKAEKKKRNT